jgi:hypothetical protein
VAAFYNSSPVVGSPVLSSPVVGPIGLVLLVLILISPLGGSGIGI